MEQFFYDGEGISEVDYCGEVAYYQKRGKWALYWLEEPTLGEEADVVFCAECGADYNNCSFIFQCTCPEPGSQGSVPLEAKDIFGAPKPQRAKREQGRRQAKPGTRGITQLSGTR